MGLFGFGKLLVSKYRDPRKTPSPATDWAKQDRETVWSGPPSIVAIDNAPRPISHAAPIHERKNRVMVRRKGRGLGSMRQTDEGESVDVHQDVVTGHGRDGYRRRIGLRSGAGA